MSHCLRHVEMAVVSGHLVTLVIDREDCLIPNWDLLRLVEGKQDSMEPVHLASIPSLETLVLWSVATKVALLA